jgi:DNA-binding beta-propeller fold protein YncE
VTPQRAAIGKATAALAVIVLVAVAAVGVILLMPHGSSSASSTSTLTAISTGPVPLGSSFGIANVTVTKNPYFHPLEIYENSKTGKLYVPDGTNNVTIVDSSTYAVIGALTLPGSPQSEIAIDSVTNMLYVSVLPCNQNPNASNACQPGFGVTMKGGIVEINGSNDAIVGEIPVGVDFLAVNPSAGVLYGGEGEHLLSINLRTGSLIYNTSLSATIGGVAVDSKTNMVYLIACKTASLGCIGGELLGVYGSSGKVKFSIPLNFNFIEGVVVDLNTNTVYTVATLKNLTLLSINGASGAVRYSSNIAACGVGAGGVTLALDTASNRVYMTASGYLLTADAATGRAVNMLSVPGAWNVSVSPTGAKVYLAMEAGNERFGYLFVLPSDVGESYVNSGALNPSGGCFP